MIQMLDKQFDMQKDEGLIFEARSEGEAITIFNYRAYLNGEEQPKRDVEKENKHVKLFFHCPTCRSTAGKLKPDDDGDIIMICDNCDRHTLVK